MIFVANAIERERLRGGKKKAHLVVFHVVAVVRCRAHLVVFHVVAVKCYGYNYVPGTNNGTPGMNNGGTPRTNNDAPETNNDYRDFWRGCDYRVLGFGFGGRSLTTAFVRGARRLVMLVSAFLYGVTLSLHLARRSSALALQSLHGVFGDSTSS